MLEISADARMLAGILLLALITVETGGYYLTRIARGHVPATDFQRSFARAGHGHAGIFVTLGLITAVLADATSYDGALLWVARSFVPLAAIVMPAGFFFSSMGAGRTAPNRLFVLVWIGAAILAVGLATLGIGLIAA